MLMPTNVPMTHSVLAGQVCQIIMARRRVINTPGRAKVPEIGKKGRAEKCVILSAHLPYFFFFRLKIRMGGSQRMDDQICSTVGQGHKNDMFATVQLQIGFSRQ